MSVYGSFLAAIAFMAFSNSAFAYIDPGTGSMVLQMAVAGILAGLFYIKTAWSRIRFFFTNLFSREKGNVKPPAGETGRNSDED
jgi:hypothetical protein